MADPSSATLEPPPYTTFDTERLHMRTLLVSDAQAILPIISDAGVMKWTSLGRPITDIGQAERWLKDRALGQDVFNFAVHIRGPKPSTADGRGHEEPKQLIGIIGSFHWPSVGYLINPGTRAVSAAEVLVRCKVTGGYSARG